MSNRELLDQKQGIRLDIGCGPNKQAPDWVGIDKRSFSSVDIIHDLEIIPWPIPDECVLVSVASHLVEHINPASGGFIDFMDEVWRITKVDGEFAISCPHGSSQGYLQDPTHCNALNEVTWAYFDPLEQRTKGALYNIYKPKPWRIKFLTWSPSANIEVVLVKRELNDWQNEKVYYE